MSFPGFRSVEPPFPQAQITRIDFREIVGGNQNYLHSVVNSLRGIFYDYLESINTRKEYHLHHPGLNCRYGLELEFFSSKNRYVIINRVNSCMFNQNGKWWRRNFNALNSIPSEINASDKPITSGDSFDEWSSFFFEAAEDYKSKSHKGDENCGNEGNGGQRIENDSSVTLDNNGPGITLWSTKHEHQGTDLKAEDSDVWNNDARGLRGDVVFYEYEQPAYHCSQHTLKPGKHWSQGNNEYRLNIAEQNEWVTNVLTDAHVKYPNKRLSDGTRVEGYLPLGGLLLDNALNHMLSHTNVLLTQRCGFHVHLSEFPKIDDMNERVEMIIGFVKIFYIFEPLLYAFHPYYRSTSDWCQSLQSIFTADEMLSDEEIWNDLVNDTPIGGVNRKLKGGRYVALNLKNCEEGGIGTLEVRIGHSTFDSYFIQSYIHILQSLFQFNRALLEEQKNKGYNIGNRYAHHNQLLNMKDILIPYYCFQTPAQYNSPANPNQIVNQNNQGAPISGFFESCGNNYNYKTQIIQNLMKLLEGCMGSGQALDYLVPFLIEYHTNNNTWLNLKSMNTINLPVLKKQVWVDLDMNWNDDNDYNDFLNNFMPVTAGTNYYINDKSQYMLDHKCRTCSQNRHGSCKSDYNGQNYPDETHQERQYMRNYSDESNLYATFCNGHENHQKLQTELINAKISDYNQGGGKRRYSSKTRRQGKKAAKKNTRKRGGRVLMAERTFELPTMNKFEPIHLVKSVPKYMKINKKEDSETFYHVNQDAERIYTKKNKDGKLIAGYGNWQGGFTSDLGLSLIFNTLLEKKILTQEQLDTLIKHRYVDYYVYLLETDVHTRKLIEELGEKFQISPETIEKIRSVYKAGKAEVDKPANKKVFKFKV